MSHKLLAITAWSLTLLLLLATAPSLPSAPSWGQRIEEEGWHILHEPEEWARQGRLLERALDEVVTSTRSVDLTHGTLRITSSGAEKPSHSLVILRARYHLAPEYLACHQLAGVGRHLFFRHYPYPQTGVSMQGGKAVTTQSEFFAMFTVDDGRRLYHGTLPPFAIGEVRRTGRDGQVIEEWGTYSGTLHQTRFSLEDEWSTHSFGRLLGGEDVALIPRVSSPGTPMFDGHRRPDSGGHNSRHPFRRLIERAIPLPRHLIDRTTLPMWDTSLPGHEKTLVVAVRDGTLGLFWILTSDDQWGAWLLLVDTEVSLPLEFATVQTSPDGVFATSSRWQWIERVDAEGRHVRLPHRFTVSNVPSPELMDLLDATPGALSTLEEEASIFTYHRINDRALEDPAVYTLDALAHDLGIRLAPVLTWGVAGSSRSQSPDDWGPDAAVYGPLSNDPEFLQRLDEANRDFIDAVDLPFGWDQVSPYAEIYSPERLGATGPYKTRQYIVGEGGTRTEVDAGTPITSE